MSHFHSRYHLVKKNDFGSTRASLPQVSRVEETPGHIPCGVLSRGLKHRMRFEMDISSLLKDHPQYFSGSAELLFLFFHLFFGFISQH